MFFETGAWVFQEPLGLLAGTKLTSVVFHGLICFFLVGFPTQNDEETKQFKGFLLGKLTLIRPYQVTSSMQSRQWVS